MVELMFKQKEVIQIFGNFEPFLDHFNQLILGKTLLTIIVCTDNCNSQKKLENSCFRWLHLKITSEIVLFLDPVTCLRSPKKGNCPFYII